MTAGGVQGLQAETATSGVELTPGQEYVAQLEIEHARAKPEQKADRPWWTLPVSVVAAAAGFGVVLVALGAVVMWLRLLADGLPVDQALSSVSYGSLAVTGARTLVVPVLLGVAFVLAVQAWLDFKVREGVRAADRGENPPPEPLRRTRRAWGRADEALLRTIAWVDERRRLRLLLLPIVLPLGKFTALLNRYPCLNLLWVVLWFPLIPSWTAIVVCYTLSWRYSRHVYATAHITQRSRQGIRLRALGGYAAAVVVVAMVGQFDHQQLPPAKVTMTNGTRVSGLYVGTNAESVTLGVGHHLRIIPRTEVGSTTISTVPAPRHAARSAMWKLGEAVVSIF